jgi:Protein of unknown function (DUF3662)/FHA domain
LTLACRKEADVGGLQRLEQRLEGMVYGAFARVFRSAVQPVEIAAALERECDNNAQILSRQRRAVPNDFHVELAATDFDRLAPYDSTLAQELAEQLKEHADQQHYVFPGPVTIAFESADDLSTGRFRIKSRAQAAVTSNSNLTRQRRPRAVLEVNGTQHPLQPPGLVVGRGTEADVRINDPGVSRRHIEFTVHPHGAGDAGYEIEVGDLGSTNGMLVDGHRIARTPVGDGTRVKIGNTTLTVRITEEADGNAAAESSRSSQRNRDV